MDSFSSHNDMKPSVINSIILAAHYLLNQMIVQANSRTDVQKGDPKVGGHSSASTSAIHILGALHLVVRKGFDFIANKPHASPADHSYHYLLNLLLDKNGVPLSPEEALQAMKGLRKFPTEENPYVFQSYHSHHDPDHHNFLPSGTVGIPPVVLGYLALAYEYLKDQEYKVPPAHFWALIGDSEFREGSLFEALPDLAEREVGSLTWIIDYNRQSLDGHRSTHPSLKTDAHRIENTFLANGWKVIQLRHGEKRLRLFNNPEGALFQNFLENEISDWDLQVLLQIKNSKDHRRFILQKEPRLKKFLNNVSDKILTEVLYDLGGHDIKKTVQALEESKTSKAPCVVIAHTIKGWGLEMASLGGNHSSIPSKKELELLRKNIGCSKNNSTNTDFPKFLKSSEEGKFLQKRHTQLMAEMDHQKELKIHNQKHEMKSLQDFPSELGIPLKMMSYPHTQWMFGQWMSKMSRIAGSSRDQISSDEKSFFQAARRFVSLSPDVGTSTNLSFNMDDKIYQPKKKHQQREEDWGVGDKKSPKLQPDTLRHHRFLRFEIAEASALSCLAAFGKIKNILGVNIFPVMSVYDFFVKRALDQYFYALYWNSNFILAGTPSGVTLSPEGAQHGWKSDFQIPGQICWEPFFCVEVDWILTSTLYRHITGENQGRSGVLIRAVTRGVDQKQFFYYLKQQARFKKSLGNQKLHPQNFPLSGAVDESKVESISEVEMREDVRNQVLKGAYPLVDFKGYKDYSTGENVINIFAMGALGTEALKASKKLLERGVYANIIIVTSPDLLLGILAHQDKYSYLKTGLGLEKKTPLLSVHDGEAGLLDNIGSILGGRQKALAVRKHSLCGRPSDIYTYHGLDSKHIEESALNLLNNK